MTKKQVVRIDAVRKKIAGVIVLGENEHDVLQLRLATQQRLEDADTSDSTAAIVAAVRETVPTLSETEIGDLQIDQAQAILTLAGAGLAAVERMFPNAVGPETSTSPA